MPWKTTARARSLLAGEQGTIFASPGSRLRLLLAYPNTYRVGMSNLGFQAVYYLLNQLPGVSCERAFLPEGPGRLISLETQTPAGDFDVIGFSLPYELDCLNVLKMLRAAGIPLRAEQREAGPLVLAGGAWVSYNPLPLAEIADAFVIGEAETALAPLAQALAGRPKREDALRRLTEVPGVWVPSPASRAPHPATRVYPPHLDDWPTCSRVLTRETEFGDLFLIELSRGCGRGCRFCVADYCYRPPRRRSLECLLDQARQGLRFRETIGLVAAAVSDYPAVEELVAEIRGMGGRISVSSLRADSLTPALVKALAESGVRTLTLAPEAGSDRLRQVLHKGIAEESYLEACRQAAALGIPQIKLYFMLGIPGEDEQDVAAIVALAERVRRLGVERLSLSVSCLVPKPGTPFERIAMETPSSLDRKQRLLRKLVAGKADISFESPRWSLIQGALARGDRRLGGVMIAALEGGESFRAWKEAFRAAGLTAEEFACRSRPPEEALPWREAVAGAQPVG